MLRPAPEQPSRRRRPTHQPQRRPRLPKSANLKHSEAGEEDFAHSGASGQRVQVKETPLKGALAAGLALLRSSTATFLLCNVTT